MSAGTPSDAPSSKEAPSGSGIACSAGTIVYSAAVPQPRWRAAISTQTRSPTRLGLMPGPTASIVPAPSWLGTRNAPSAAVERLRVFQSVGLTPETATLTRTSPAPGAGASTSRTLSAAVPPEVSQIAASMRIASLVEDSRHSLRRPEPRPLRFLRDPRARDSVLPDGHGRRARPRGARDPRRGRVHRAPARARDPVPGADQQLDLHPAGSVGEAATARHRHRRGEHLDLGACDRAFPRRPAARRDRVRRRRGRADHGAAPGRLHDDRQRPGVRRAR